MLEKLKTSNYYKMQHKINEIIDAVNSILSELNEESTYRLEQKEREG